MAICPQGQVSAPSCPPSDAWRALPVADTAWYAGGWRSHHHHLTRWRVKAFLVNQLDVANHVQPAGLERCHNAVTARHAVVTVNVFGAALRVFLVCANFAQTGADALTMVAVNSKKWDGMARFPEA